MEGAEPNRAGGPPQQIQLESFAAERQISHIFHGPGDNSGPTPHPMGLFALETTPESTVI